MTRNMVALPQIPLSMGLSMSVALAKKKEIGLFCQRKDAQRCVENILRSSLLFAQLVWILRRSARMVTMSVTIPAPIIVEPSQSCTSISFTPDGLLKWFADHAEQLMEMTGLFLLSTFQSERPLRV
jgi:hypothetical protein